MRITPRTITKDKRKTLDHLIAELRNKPSFDKVGAIGAFIGIVRGITSQGDEVAGLEIEAYEEKADEVLENICQDLKQTEGIVDVQIYHFLGDFDVGEELVQVVVTGSHREEVFKTLRLAVERYKREAPIFKKELIIEKETGRRKEYWTQEVDKT